MMLRFALVTCAIGATFVTSDDPLSPDVTDANRRYLTEVIRRKQVEDIQHEGYRPLHLAAQEGYTGIARQLLELGADANARLSDLAEDRATPLHLAVQWGHVDMVRLLVDGGARIDAGSGGERNETALQLALRQRRSSAARVLIELGADVNVESGSGWTPLANAAQKGDVNMVRQLLKAGADPSMRLGHRLGGTALHTLALPGMPNRWSLAGLVALYQAGADLDARLDDGCTLLFLAHEEGSFAMVDFLIWLGADPTMVSGRAAAGVGCVPHQGSPAELEQERSSRRLLRLETDRARARRAAGLPEQPGVVGAADSRS